MSTWHQDKAGANAAPSSWTIETNPPGEMRTRMTGFATRAEAEKRLAEWTAAGRGAHSYIIGPGEIVPPQPTPRMAAGIYARDGNTARKYVAVERPKGAPRARTEAHFWGMLRNALNDDNAGNRYAWVLWRPHKTEQTSMPYALSRGPNRDVMVIDNHYAERDVRALYNAGEAFELQVIAS
jgi:hypothetical protein